MKTFGTLPERDEEITRAAIRKECMTVAGFASFLVTYPIKASQKHNSASHAERTVCTVRNYYLDMLCRTPGSRRDFDVTNTLRGVTRGLRKLYPTEPMSEVPLLAYDMWAIRRTMDLDYLRDLSYWALSAAQWHGFMRGSDILRPATDNNHKCQPGRNTHVGQIFWEPIDAKGNGVCETSILCRLKRSKTDQSGETQFKKTFLVDHRPSSISEGAAISARLHNRVNKDDWDHVNTPLFLNPDTVKDLTITASLSMLKSKVREAVLSQTHIKGHSLRIEGATAYANSTSGGAINAGFLGLWASGARCNYMDAYRRSLELAGLAVSRETGVVLATRPGPVGTYAQDAAPK